MDNPYQAPVEPMQPEAVAEGPVPARRWMRLIAALFDGILVGVFAWLMLYVLYGVTPLNAKETMTFERQVLIAVFGYVFFFAINGWLLYTNAQTLGKKLARIKVVQVDGSPIPFSSLILKRYLPVWVAGHIPYAGGLFGLVDALLIFRQDRRCIHDHIAGTIVVAC